MKKLLFISVLVLAVSSVFAQNAAAPAPAPKYEIYGSTFFDYQMSGTEASYSTPALSDFTFSKLRIGFKAQLADTVKSTFEFDPRNGEFRHAYMDWMPMDNLTITAGKTYIFFEQITQIYGGARNYFLGAKYAMPGLGWAGLQVGNKSDISYISGNYLIFPAPSAAAAQTETWSYRQDPWLYLWPAIVFKPSLGDISLEVGLEGQFIPQQMGSTNATGASMDAYFTVGAYGFTFTNEFTWQNFNNSNAAAQEYTYYAQLTYNAGFVAPTVYLVTDVLNNFSNNPNTAIGVEIPFVVSGSFKINPLFSYAIANYNAFEGNNAIVQHLYNTNDWTLGIRFDYSYSVKF
jgi:hypothetical protein